MDKSHEITELLKKTRVTTIQKKDVYDGVIRYQFMNERIAELRLDAILVAEMNSSDVVIMKKGLPEFDDCLPLPFIGMLYEKLPVVVMENLLCYLLLTSTKPNVYYTDGAYTYAYTSNDMIDETLEKLGLEPM